MDDPTLKNRHAAALTELDAARDEWFRLLTRVDWLTGRVGRAAFGGTYLTYENVARNAPLRPKDIPEVDGLINRPVWEAWRKEGALRRDFLDEVQTLADSIRPPGDGRRRRAALKRHKSSDTPRGASPADA